jgi:Pectate lyase superfamily protein
MKTIGIKAIRAIVLQSLCIGCTSSGLTQPLPNSLMATDPNLKLNLSNIEKHESISQSIPSFTLSVKKIGAMGDGVTDDTKAIQTTIDTVAAKGGGTVFFPSGTYKVLIQPQQSRALTIDKNIVLKGEGTQNSTIKLGDRQGNYDAILAGAAMSSNLSNFSIQNLTIDANATANPIATEQSFQGERSRFVLRIYVGKNILIENCRFTNIKDVNVLTINNDQLVSDIVIQNNRFDGIGGGSFDHDHSTLYILGKRSIIARNTFVSTHGPGTYGARTAIEIHGDEHQVLNNQISGYTFGINVTGVASSSKGQRIEGNTIAGAHTGIVLWSYISQDKSSAFGLENLKIDRNQIDLDVMGWRKLWGDSPNQGIALEANSNAPIKDLQITNNKINFHHFKDAGRKTDVLSAGIILWRAKAPNVSTQNIAIAQNEIRNPLASGLYIAMSIQQLKIAQNTIFDVGQGQYPFHPHYRSGLIVGVNTVSMQITQNQFVDTQPQPTMTAGMLWQGNCAQDCTQQNNQLLVRAKTQVPLLIQTP